MTIGLTPRLQALPPVGGAETSVGATGTSAGVLPEFVYTPTAGLEGNTGTFLADYYGQMAKDYLPQVDTFAQQNAGNMVAWNPNQFMGTDDFGIRTDRAAQRGPIDAGYFVGEQFHKGNPDAFYRKDGDGNYVEWRGDSQSGFQSGIPDGAEVFTRTADGGDNPGYIYTAAGAYRKETPAEAFARMQKQGGEFSTNRGGEFGGSEALEGLTTSKAGKWGADPVNMPELAQYINDPNWVQRGEGGKITGMRAELVPLVFREQLGIEFRDMQRAGTKHSNVIGDIVKTAILSIVTMGAGVAASAALGLTAAGAATGIAGAVLPSGTALTTTGSMVAGGLSGGLGAAVNGGNIATGILTGGLGGAAPLVSGGLASTGIEWLDRGTLLNNALTTGAMGGARVAAAGGDMGDLGASMLAGAGSSLVMEGLAYNNLTTGIGAIDNVVGSLVNQAIGGAVDFGSDAASPTQATQEATQETEPTVQPSVPTRSSNIQYVKR